ncbi:hypothetical protein OIU78_000336 [Salix suchowensis]|nr:hypothetical protein OIU78_000336 [Salix suchowensis]
MSDDLLYHADHRFLHHRHHDASETRSPGIPIYPMPGRDLIQLACSNDLIHSSHCYQH